MTLINDLSDRKKANDLARSYVVKAPAGSGKTTMLVGRLMMALERVNEPEEVLAITFTRKASEEMRKRVLNLLALKNPANVVDQDLLEVIKKIRKRDAERGWNLQANPSRLSIMTIDAFCSSILKRASLVSELFYSTTIEEDYKTLYALAARRALSEISSAEHGKLVGRVLWKYDSDWSRVEQQLAETLEQRDSFFLEIGLGIKPEEIKQHYSRLIESRLKNCESLFSVAQKHAIVILYDFSEANLNPKSPQLIETFPSAKPDFLITWHKMIERLIFTKTNTLRKNLTAANGFPSDAPESKVMKEIWKKTIGEMSTSTDLINKLLQIRALPPKDIALKDSGDLLDILELFKLASAHLKLIFSQRQATDFTQQALDAVSALGDLEAPSDLALKLDYRLQHILVDEFQDTSPVQLELLRKLVSGWVQGDGRSLFLVGDPMQSIYRFRKADMDLFNQLFRLGRIESLPLERLTLVNNFRSQSSLVDWINQLFPAAFEVVGSSPDFFVPQKAVVKESFDNPCTLHNVASNDRLIEANYVSDLVDAICHKECQLKLEEKSSICILGRSKSHLEEIAKTLKKRGVKFTSTELSSLADLPAIQDLMIVTRILLHPSDRVAWFALLRAPWAGFTLEALSVISSSSVLRDFLLNSREVIPLPREDLQRLNWLRDTLQKYYPTLKTHSLFESLKMTWAAMGGNSLYDDANSREAIRKFFGMIDGLDKEGGLVTYQKINRLIEKTYPDNRENNPGQINIMTIHKAKGLEFDIVIVPSVHRTVRSEPQSLLYWENFQSDLSIGGPVVAAFKNDSSNSLYSFLRSFEVLKVREEVVRLFYVALTRARKKVHLVGKIFDPEEGLNETKFVRAAKGSFLELISKQTPLEDIEHSPNNSPLQSNYNESIDLRRMDIPRREIARNQDIGIKTPHTSDLKSLEFEWAGIAARQVGIVTHHIFQNLDELINLFSNEVIVEKSLRYAKTRFRSMGVSVRGMTEALRRTEVGLQNILYGERGRWLFSGSHSQVQNELELFPGGGFSDKKIIIDRTFVDQNGLRWIIDYKTGYHDGSDIDSFLQSETLRHKPQLDYYAEVLSLEELREIRLGLYFPLLDSWKEWPYY